MHTATTVCVDCHLCHAAEFVLPKIMLFFFGFVLDGLPPLGPLLFFGGGLRVCWAFASWPSFFFVLVYLGSLTSVRA